MRQRVRESSRNSLRYYVEKAWEVIDPEPFLSNWHIDCVCEYLTYLTEREITNIVFNLPPGLAKSLLVAVMWPTWEWIDTPHERYLFSAYGLDLATRDTKRSRDLILSDWYQYHFGDCFELRGDQNLKTHYENDRLGIRKATSVGGGTTGARAKTLVLDDPHKLEEFDYPEQQARAVEHKNIVLGTRGSGQGLRKVVMMQRVGALDVTEDIVNKMEEGGEHYEMLVLPMRYEPSVQLDLMKLNRIPWHEVDKRKVEGELLHAKLFDELATSNLEINLQGRADVHLQQHRTSSQASIFKREWWDVTENPHSRFDITDGLTKNGVYERYLLFDTNFKDKDSAAYTACVVLEVMAGTYTTNVRYVERRHLDFPRLLGFIKDMALLWNMDGLLVDIVIEDRASGISAVQTLRANAEPWIAERIVGFAPPGSKDEKCRQAAVYCQYGLIGLPLPSQQADWLTWFSEQELFKVPAATTRDATDAFALGILYLEHYLEEARQALIEFAGAQVLRG